MKKLLAIVAVAGFLTACNNGSSSTSGDSMNNTTTGIDTLGSSSTMSSDSTHMMGDTTTNR